MLETYNPTGEHAVHPLDPELGIEWPAEVPQLSARDAAAPTLAQARAAGLLPDYATCRAFVAELAGRNVVLGQDLSAGAHYLCCDSDESASGRLMSHSWSGESSASRPSTASPAPIAGSGGCPRTRSPGICSVGWCPGAGRATCSCATAPGSTWTSARTRSTRRRSATRCTDLVAHDRAGERILEGLLVDAEKRLHDEGIAGEIYLFKNNTDSAGNSYGCHENYLVSRHGEFGRLADVLIPFLVTRQLICGAGKVLQTPRGAVYCLSQRAEHIWEGVSSATTRSRPIINTRDEPHADAERYRRLHVIVGDSNMNEVTTLLKVGTADIVLRMIEAGVVMRDLSLENPIRAIREVSHDITGRRKVRLATGKEVSALEIQQEYWPRPPSSSSAAAATRPPSGSSSCGAGC